MIASLATGRARTAAVGLLVALAAVLPSCEWDGHFTLLGYTTKPNYDERYRTVYVPIFETHAFQSGPLRGLEYELTKEVQRQIIARDLLRNMNLGGEPS